MWIKKIDRKGDNLFFIFISEEKEVEEEVELSKVKSAYKKAIKPSNDFYKISKNRNIYYGRDGFFFICPHKNKMKIGDKIITGKEKPQGKIRQSTDNSGAIYCYGNTISLNHSDLLKISKLIPGVDMLDTEELAKMDNLSGCKTVEFRDSYIIINGFIEFTYEEITDSIKKTIFKEPNYVGESNVYMIESKKSEAKCSKCKKSHSRLSLINKNKICRYRREVSLCESCILEVYEKAEGIGKNEIRGKVIAENI